jgi:hypothetical protein
VAVQTRHRYGKRELQEKMRRAGLEVSYISYANCLLFPVALSMRLAERVSPPRDGSDVHGVSAPVNGLLSRALKLEAAILRRRSLPFGLSLITVAARR